MRSSTRTLGYLLGSLVLAGAGCGGADIPTDAVAVTTPDHGAPKTTVRVAPDSAVVQRSKTIQLAGTVTVDGSAASAAGLAWSVEDTSIVGLSASGVVSARKVGSTRIIVSMGAEADTARVWVIDTVKVTPPKDTTTSPPIVVTPPVDTSTPSSGGWTYCAKAGTVCEFSGRRLVRLADPTGTKAVSQVAYHEVPCASYGFADQDPAPGKLLHCDYGPIQLQTLTNPAPGMGPVGATVVVPLGADGSPDARTMPQDGAPVRTDGSGAFRTTCSLARYAFNDPIVFPGRTGASHLHQFFGNTGVNASSTPQSLSTSGNSTCRGGSLNRTTYWVPALLDSRTGEVQVPDEGIFYYKTGYDMDPKVIQPFPAGLRMIAGDKNATSKQEYIGWSCRDKYMDAVATVTTCPIGDAVRLTVEFPQCWDGKNLDSPDHKSHMAYPIYSNTMGQSKCPADHPVPLPEITEHFDYPMTKTSQPAFWRLSSDMYSTSIKGGLSAHADWMGAWDPATMNTIVTQCLNKALDCGVGSIGNGRDLF